MRIDLNADLGEGMASDEAMMPFLSSCNIASGGHVGDSVSMRFALRLAKVHGVSAGVHPSYPDPEQFGRQTLEIAAEDLQHSIRQQIETLATIAGEEGVALTHVKPHGALYNDIARDRTLAEVIVSVVPKGMALVGLAGSLVSEVAERAGIDFIGEAFIDRRYTEEGFLQPRGEAGAVIEDPSSRITQAIALAKRKPLTAMGGATVSIEAQTLCLHGDTPGAAEAAREVRDALIGAGVKIVSAYD